MTNSFLITGSAGFIGAALCKRLLDHGEKVIGIDNLNDYYDPSLKKARLEDITLIAQHKDWSFHQFSIEDDEKVFETNCENISGSGLKVILELEGVRDCPLNVDDEIALGLNMPPILDLEGRGILDQGDSHLELPPFAARVVRAHEIESRSIHTKRWAIGISYEYSEEFVEE